VSVAPGRVRELVAELPGSLAGAHHGHADFRVKNKVFATLSEAEDRAGLRLGQLEARELALREPAVFRLVSDREPHAWVSALLSVVDESVLADLLETAWSLRGGQPPR
jgi:predicted DNA-binding protein (MmcQ/YjbR family)